MRLILHRSCRQQTRNADDKGCEVMGVFRKLLRICSVESKRFVENRNWSARGPSKAEDFRVFRGLNKLLVYNGAH